jgi:hypothetical protein
MDQNQNNVSVCDVLIAIRRIIQSVDLHSKHLVKQFGLTGPQLIVAAGDFTIRGDLGQRYVPGRQPQPGHGHRHILDRLEKRGLIAQATKQPRPPAGAGKDHGGWENSFWPAHRL